jgi:hypothetical protein
MLLLKASRRRGRHSDGLAVLNNNNHWPSERRCRGGGEPLKANN